ncbi:hypothetical protein CTEN210_14558 [Chaetoceros tenuissimus]|uniref:Uncharacterized protein n=1 Tax=Chaetoceros tenuissimus TaxID=426638 RepID=A0AAD3HBV7_9STRA|nr:hypothetical protein CTEN210_14558 [Chaetoceros tenuissimus]
MLVIIFGRPGAGKSSVTDKALQLCKQEKTSGYVHGLDLDVCVPQWMRDNFGKGIYPTLEQRKEFAVGACDYVDEQKNRFETDACGASVKILISFSFVNTDLRDVFRERFPDAKWILVDTSGEEAQDRIQKREGHFYKGAPTKTDSSETDSKSEMDVASDVNNEDNSEWNFAKVEFEHLILNGLDSIEDNAQKIIEIIMDS